MVIVNAIDLHSLNQILRSNHEQNEGELYKWFSLIYISINGQKSYRSSAYFLLWLHHIPQAEIIYCYTINI